MIALCLAILAIGKTASALDSETAINQYASRVWQAEHGLPQNSIQAIAQTEDGLLWLGTQEGLVAFDGFEFRVFDKSSVARMNNIDIRSLATGPKNRLWLGNGAGQVFARRDRSFVCVMPVENKAPITAMIHDRQGDLWIGTQGNGLWKVTEGGLATKPELSFRLPSSSISALLEDSQGQVWVGTQDRGLARIKGDTIRVFGLEDGLPGLDVTVLLEYPVGTIWIGTEIHGLIRFSQGVFSQMTQADGLSSDSISALCGDPDDNLWVGTDGGGVTRITGADVVPIPTWAVSHRNIGALLVDQELNLWVGTAGGGLNRFSDVLVKTYARENGMPDNMVWVIYADPLGGVWFGTRGGGMAHFSQGDMVDRTAEFDLRVDPSVFLRSTNGRFWVGTQGRGLFRRQNGELTLFRQGDSELKDDFVSCLVEAVDGTIWIGGMTHGISRFDGNQFIPEDLQTSPLPADGITDIRFDIADPGVVWIGTPQGLVRWTPDEVRGYDETDGLVDAYVSAIHQDQSGVLWIGSYGSGLSRFERGKIDVFSRADGLIDESVFKIMEGPQQRLWLSSNRGIFCVPIDSFHSVLDGSTAQLDIQAFDRTDGMKTSECNHIGPGSGTVTAEGILWFPTIKGAVRVDPRNLNRIEEPPQIHIQHVVSDEGRHPPGPGLTFPPGSSNFEFHFTAPSFRAPDKVRFRFKLEGFDTDWVETSGRRTAYYSSLAPGSYRFLVTAARRDSPWADPPAELSFALEPHTYQHPMFFLAVATLIVFLGFVAHRARTRAHQKRQRELERQVKFRTDELAKTKTELVRVNEELAENARLSGMAEIASGVLHNIANALNSAGTSIDLMGKLFREPTSTRVINRIAELVTDHRQDLGRFLDHHPQGQKLPAALETLSGILEKNRDIFLGEFDTVRQQIRHIQDIVADQKDLGWAQRSQEIVDINLLIETALRMNKRRFERLEIKTVTHFSPVPLTCLNPSDFLQVIANLIKNACEAVMETPPDRQRRIEIRTSLADEDRICIQVQDSGPGFDEAHASQLFDYGFTTKKEGFGFGLHFSATIIRKMNGDISARNADGNRGAVFSVFVPIVRETPPPEPEINHQD